ncbi:hypothetical protein ACFYO8_10725 [Micromonospora sp. NPDC005257]|uniref:hypothetical protein n=1 Tax=Micromonospora sp. NPDC005257 TaxID=3364230 RepID=UPI003691606E
MVAEPGKVIELGHRLDGESQPPRVGLEFYYPNGQVMARFGQLPDGTGRVGMEICDETGAVKVLAGELVDGQYGLAAYNPQTGGLVDLATLAFGVQADVVTTTGVLSGSGSMRDIPGSYGPEVTVKVGNTGRCIVTVSAEIEVELREDLGNEAGAGQAGFVMTRLSDGSEAIPATTNRSAMAEFGYDNGSHIGWTPAFNLRSSATRVNLIEGLESGEYKVTMKYYNLGNDAKFANRTLIVQPF